MVLKRTCLKETSDASIRLCQLSNSQICSESLFIYQYISDWTSFGDKTADEPAKSNALVAKSAPK